jgi:hypothetical protein
VKMKLTKIIFLAQLDTSTRLSIRDSLLRLANSSSQRQIAGYRTISDNSKRGEDDITENGASNKRKRYIASCQSGLIKY